MSCRRFAVLTVVAFALVAFSFSNVSAKLKVVVRTVPAVAAQTYLKSIPAKFKKATGIDVKIEFVASRALGRKLITAAETKSGADMVMALYNRPVTVKESLEPLDDVLKPLEKKYGGFSSVFYDAGYVDGKWLAAPYIGVSQILNYRKDLLKKIGENPPDTWEDALRIGKKLKKAKLAPWAEALGSHVIDPSTTVLCILWGYGSKQVSTDGKRITLDSPETRAGLKFIKKAYKEAWPKATIGWKTLENNQGFLGGKIGMTINAASIWWKSSQWNVNRKKKKSWKPKKKWKFIYENIGFSLIPRGPAGRHCTSIPMTLVLLKHSKHKKDAKEFIKFMLRPEIQTEYAVKSWMFIPVYNGLAAKLPDNEFTRVMAKQAKFAHLPGWPGPPSKAGAQTHARFVLLSMAQRYVKGQNIDDSIKQAVKELRKLYKVQ
tara:strand:+ start:3708 stop:5003 length:1296 start_codon:yes stop_codon:yes gene_type:complete